MAAYSKNQLEALWIHAGGNKTVASVAAAIALAESSGNPNAHNASGATGLWQILGADSPGNLYNPEVNAKNAVEKYRAAGGFSPWVTYTSGAYKSELGGSTLASKGEGYLNSFLGSLFGPGAKLGAEGAEGAAEPAVEAAGGFKKTEEGVVKGLSSTGEFVTAITEPATWLRLAEGLGGVVLFFLGLKTLTRGTSGATIVNQQTGSVKGAARKVATKAAEVAAVPK
jgi:hypothetical protein